MTLESSGLTKDAGLDPEDCWTSQGKCNWQLANPSSWSSCRTGQVTFCFMVASLSLSLFPPFLLSVSVSLSLFVCLSVCRSFGLSVSVSVSVSLCLSLSVSLSLSVCLSVCLSLSLSLSVVLMQRTGFVLSHKRWSAQIHWASYLPWELWTLQRTSFVIGCLNVNQPMRTFVAYTVISCTSY